MNSFNPLVIAGRESPLSRAQIQEVEKELLAHHPNLSFQRIYVKTTGDKDKNTSLRTLDKTDFFTRELDELVLNNGCHVCAHSAKDLPDLLTEGLEIYAITRGVDNSDSLVLREGETLESIQNGGLVATSSAKREENVRTLAGSFRFRDLRGTIQERIALLDTGEADGVVIAEAALIRLGLTHLNRIKLPGRTTPLQGQLALVGRQNEPALMELLAPLDSRLCV